MTQPPHSTDALRRLIERAAPALRAADAVIADNEALRAARDSAIDHAAALLKGDRRSRIVDAEVVEADDRRRGTARVDDPVATAAGTQATATVVARPGHASLGDPHAPLLGRMLLAATVTFGGLWLYARHRRG